MRKNPSSARIQVSIDRAILGLAVVLVILFGVNIAGAWQTRNMPAGGSRKPASKPRAATRPRKPVRSAPQDDVVRVPGPIKAQIKTGKPVKPVSMDQDLRSLPYVPSAARIENEEEFEREPPPVKEKHPLPGAIEPPPAPEVSQPVPELMPATSVQFDGLNKVANGAGWPPDIVGDVGPNHYVQAVNTSWGIYNKTGTLLASNTFNGLWSGAGTGTLCDANHQGDPTVIFDPAGARWILADFAFTGTGTTPPFYECIAVSKTTDPVAGGWWLYAIRTDDATHPWLADYPKMGIWPDGLYMTANMFNSAGVFQEVRVWAFNRSDLAAGLTVRNVVVDTATTTYFALLPSNYRGVPPPAGRENLLVTESQTLFAFHIFKFHVDYSGAGSTFTGPTNVSQTSYTVAPASVASPANALDTLRERLMMQAQYRNIGGVESLWVNHTVRTGAATATGIQWAQINVTGGTIVSPPVQQQIYGNLSADGIHRWMGSLAVDRAGNMALGYSATNATNNPSIRYNGRLSTDALNTLPQGEATMISGAGSQTGNCGSGTCIRWGDYSAMTVDPSGDCRIWYTTEYYDTNSLNWLTRIGAFTFPSCTPTAAPVIITGRVLAPNGEGLPGVTVTLNEGVNQRWVLTNAKGGYTFENVATGTFCIVTAAKKGYDLAPDNVSFEAFANSEALFNATPAKRIGAPGRAVH
jgi:hypothetical protein